MTEEQEQEVFNNVSLNIDHEEIKNLLIHFSTKTYHAGNTEQMTNVILGRSLKFLKQDYDIIVADNANGRLSRHYPRYLPVLHYELECNQNQKSQRQTSTIYESNMDQDQINESFLKARFARCRGRFSVPVILFKGKHICRSSTLSGAVEIYGRYSYDYLRNAEGIPTVEIPPSSNSEELNSDCDKEEEDWLELRRAQSLLFGYLTDWQLHDKVRSEDIRLLKTLNVGSIVDFMVENKKMKYGLYVTSSEKIDRENRYSDFNLISLPYPGCEFFAEFRKAQLTATDLHFQWDAPNNNTACINIPDNPNLSNLRIDFKKYREWDLLTLTKNYLKYLLRYLQDTTTGVLIHCISGWDRTPLYISLIRLSLWADGLIHQSLSPIQILYLTLAYDWYLFGHHLGNRLYKGEDIFFFCFYFLKFIDNEEFSIASNRPSKRPKQADKSSEDNKPDGDVAMDVMFESDIDPIGSNISLNSIDSTASTQSQDTIMQQSAIDESNGNSPPLCHPELLRDTLLLGASTSPLGKRTSPVTVPSSVKKTESSATTGSVQSTGSWQFVNSTGSECSKSEPPRSADTTFSEDDSQDSGQHVLSTRKERINQVRTIFYQCFWPTLGKDIPQYQREFSISGLISNLAEAIVGTVANLTQRSS